MNRVRLPFNVGTLGQVAAIAALDDEAFVRRSREVNDAGMQQIIGGLKPLGVDYIPSRGNFICVRVGAAGKVYERLLRQGVIVRPVGAYKLPEFLRVSIGVEAENSRFLDALRVALHA